MEEGAPIALEGARKRPTGGGRVALGKPFRGPAGAGRLLIDNIKVK